MLYGLRHFFASNCLGNGIPITDVAEWMGHAGHPLEGVAGAGEPERSEFRSRKIRWRPKWRGKFR